MMIDYFIYTKTPAGKVRLNQDESLLPLLGVTSQIPGEFEIKAKGQKPQLKSYLELPLKGAQQMSMRVKVLEVNALITPIDGWSALCEGPSQSQFDIKVANITCDCCSEVTQLEFIDFGLDTQADALVGMIKSHWLASAEAQICPSCKNKANND
ncbi:hypothetical protein NBRC116188_02290 [Oceaniserpentilla sp. 4NH20-0058]|uniref:hypothetical protein n=1 Tax=Oceaniserpentilla sp. 4NH20-0058 TaxID=3127660 RepID=UPI0031059A1C